MNNQRDKCIPLVLRFIELVYIGPILQDRPVHTTFRDLLLNVSSCIRPFTKRTKGTTNDVKKREIKSYKKDRKFYHILVRSLLWITCLDVLGAWLATFTMHDIIALQERPAISIILFILTILFMTCLFNAFGFVVHLYLCVVFEGGSYSSERYRMMMGHPLLSTSLTEFWSYRWHQLFKSTWLAFPFQPTRLVTQRLLAKFTKNYVGISLWMAVISVFVVSGLMHEYMLLCNSGLPVYRQLFVGQQLRFFTIHGIGVIFEGCINKMAKPLLLPSIYNSITARALRRAWPLVFGVTFFTYFMKGFAYWGAYNAQLFHSQGHIFMTLLDLILLSNLISVVLIS